MCTFRKCCLLHSGQQINNAAAFVSMKSPFRAAQRYHLLSTWRRLLYLGIGCFREGRADKLLLLKNPCCMRRASLACIDSCLKASAMSLDSRADDAKPNPRLPSFLNPEQLYDEIHRSDCTLRAISKLSINLRTLITTWVEQERSVKELARTLSLFLATVKARLYRARKQLACSAPYQERASNISSASGSKRQYTIPRFQNRELSCPSCN